jgi:hypothetical protein
MMNMIELQDKLKNFSQDQLVSMMQQPTGEAPQFMVLSEITRRQKMQKEAESQQAPTQSVAQEAVAAAGVPQGGIADMARSLAPQTNVAQNTGVNPAAPPQGMPMPSAPQGPAPMAAAPQGIARMASGGVIKMQAAGKIDFARYRELARRLVSDKRGGTLTDSFSPEERKELDQIKGTAAFREAFDLEMRAAQTAEYELANSGSLSDINPALPRVESSAPTPVFDATVEAPSLNQAPAADAGAMKGNDFLYGDRLSSRPTYDSAAPQMPVPPKTDSMRQGPRPSGTQVNIAGNIYTVLGDGSVIDQTGRTPPPPVAELARQKAGTPAAQFTTQQQYQDAQNLANRIGANSGENAVLPSEKLLMGGGREGTPYLNTPAADTAIYAGGYDPRTNVPAAPSGLAALSPETMPTVDGPFAYPTSAEFRAQEDAMYGQKTPSRDPYLAAYSQDLIDAAKGESTISELKSGLDWLTAPKTGGIYTQEDVSKWLTPDAENPVAVPNIDNITDEELAKYTNKRPQPRPKDLFAPTTDNAREGGATTGATGSGSGSGGMSDYETELMKIMKSREKAAESDKWLALAQVGMGLMQGGSGSFLGDVGAAGMKGLETLRTSRDQADTDKLSLLKAREDARIDRARIAASAAKGTAPNATALKSVIEDLDTAMAPLAARAATGKLTRDEEMQLAQLRDQRNYYSTILGGLAGGSYGAFPAQATAAGPKDLSNPPTERGLLGKTWDAITG